MSARSSKISKFSSTGPSRHLSGPYLLQLFSALVGALASLYLAAQHTRLKSGIQEGPSFCSLGGGFDCDSVSVSSWAEIGGISLGYIGWIFFSFLFVALLLFSPTHKAHARVRNGLAWLVACGLLLDFVLLGVQIFSLKNICLVCLLTYFANFGLIAGFIWEVARETSESIRNAISHLFFHKRGARLGGGSLAMAAVLFAAFAIAGWMFAERPRETTGENPAATTPQDTQTVEQLWKLAPRKEIKLKATDASKGSKTAPVKVIVFSDFECPFCKRAAFALGNALDSYRDKVQLVFKHFPLSSECNPELDRPMHVNACLLAHLSYCANKKGKFWPFHDRVYFEFSEDDVRLPAEKVTEKLQGLFTKSEVEACLADPASKANTRDDIQEGVRLQLRGTPAIFINGKLFSLPLTPENVRQAVDWEIRG